VTAEAGAFPWLWPWEPVSPRDVGELLADLTAPWWIAGGWGLSLFVGRETRRHHDVDVSLLRRDQAALRHHLADWDLQYATPDHQLEPWDGRFLEPPITRIWARRGPGDAWCFDVLLEEACAESWLYRRDPRVSRPLSELGQTTTDGLPYLSPEISLLYKLARPTPRSKADLRAVYPRLSATGRSWLRQALETCHPDHPVLPIL
jgi:hypothetical protein